MGQGIHAVQMPKWGVEMQRGTLANWHVAVGQAVSKGDPLVDVETDKIVNAVEAAAPGVLRRVLAQTGAERPVGALLAVIANEAATEQDIDRFIADFRMPP